MQVRYQTAPTARDVNPTTGARKALKVVRKEVGLVLELVRFYLL